MVHVLADYFGARYQSNALGKKSDLLSSNSIYT